MSTTQNQIKQALFGNEERLLHSLAYDSTTLGSSLTMGLRAQMYDVEKNMANVFEDEGVKKQ
jgi:hypothetical protein